MASISQTSSITQEPQPAWDVAKLFPFQGAWEEGDYFALQTNQLVELIDGSLEVLPMPKTAHQLIVAFLYDLLRTFVTERDLGTVFFAGLPVRLRHKNIREPDIVFVSTDHLNRIGEDCSEGADLVMEVVSPDAGASKRDYIEKRKDYAEAGIPEYWIVDPQTQRITVLALVGNEYRVHGEFSPGQQSTSQLLAGFAVDTLAVFAAAKTLN